MTADYFIKNLRLQSHPEGGFFKETYRSTGIIPSQCLADVNGDRHYSTAIYFLLRQGDFLLFTGLRAMSAGIFMKEVLC